MVKTELKGPSFRDFLRIFFSRKPVIFATFLGVTLLVIIVTLLTPPTYETSTKVIAKERKLENPMENKLYFDYRVDRVAFLQTQIEILKSDELARRVLNKMMLSKREISQSDLIKFRAKIQVTSPKGYDINSSDILLIQVSDSNPVRAAEAANLLTDEFITYNFEMKGKSAKQTIAFLEKQGQASLEKLKAFEEQLKGFEGKAGHELAFLLSAVKTKGPNTELITFNSNYLNAKAVLMETETTLNQLRTMVQKGVIPTKVVRENPVLITIKDNIAKLQNQLSNLRSQYTDQFPKNAMVLKEIESNKRLLKQELETDIDGRYVEVKTLEVRVKALKETIDSYSALAQKQLEYSRIYRNYELLEDEYQNIQKEIQKAKTAEAMDTYRLANIEIIDRAKVPKIPVSPNILANILIGALVGLLLGFGLALVLDSFDHTLKSVEDVEKYLKISVLGSLPRL